MRKSFTLNFTMLIFVILISDRIFCPACQAALKGGCAKVNITPPVGVWLSGYGSRDRPSDGIVDELYVKALVLEDGRNTIAIVSADLLGVPLEITAQIRKRVKEKNGIPEENLLVCGTHTHFGPKIFAKRKIEPEAPDNTVDKSYVQTLIKKMANSVFLAHKNMQEIRIGATKGEIPEIIYNRRPKNSDSAVKMAFSLSPEVLATRRIVRGPEGLVRVTFTNRPEEAKLIFGPIDPEAWVLRVENTEGEIVGSVVNFACHAVSGSAYSDWFYSISADFPGHTMDVVEQAEGGICLFTSGTAGDMVPIKRGRKPRLQIGKALAGEVLKRLQFIPISGDIALKTLKREIDLPLKKTLSPDRIMEWDKTKKTLTTEIQALKIGELYILGLPGEILVEVGLEIKKRAALENLFIITHSNDSIGYVCHSQAYEEGGYEPGSGTNLAKGSGEIMIKQALDLINQIKPSI